MVGLLSLSLAIYGCGDRGGGTQTVKTVDWALGTSGSGSSPYIMGGVICDVANKTMEGLKVSPQVTAGFEENVGLVAKQSVQLGEASNNVVISGYGKYPDIRGLFNFLLSPIHVAVDARKGIKSIGDLKGKTVNIGAPGQATRKIAEALLNAYGLKPGDYKASALTTGEAVEALKDGHVDAVILLAETPMPGIAEVAVTREIDLLPLEGPQAEKFNADIGDLLTPTVIPAGTYKGVNHDTPTMAMAVAVIAHKDLDAELVYKFTKSVWSNLDKLQAAHEGFRSLKLDKSAISGWSKVPLHPGAEKYFKEAGVIK